MNSNINRVKDLRVMLTLQEFNELLAMEKQLGVSRSELVRLRVFKNSKAVLVDARALLELLDDLGPSIARSANNINQMAGYVSELEKGGMLNRSLVKAFKELFQIYVKQHKQLQKTLRHLLMILSQR